MAGRTVIAQKKLKNDKLLIAEAIYTQTRGTSGEYESGRIPWPDHVIEARKRAYDAKNERARRELEKYGII